MEYDYVRRCMSKGRPIEVTLVERRAEEEATREEDYSFSFVEKVRLHRLPNVAHNIQKQKKKKKKNTANDHSGR